MNQPPTIKASEWDTIADAVKSGAVEARDSAGRLIINVYPTMNWKISNEGFVLSILPSADTFYLTWKQTAPPATEALFATIAKGLNTGSMFAVGINDYISPGITDAHAALTDLRAQVAALEAERDALLRIIEGLGEFANKS